MGEWAPAWVGACSCVWVSRAWKNGLIGAWVSVFMDGLVGGWLNGLLGKLVGRWLGG